MLRRVNASACVFINFLERIYVLCFFEHCVLCMSDRVLGDMQKIIIYKK
jgi:hypothetical protein